MIRPGSGHPLAESLFTAAAIGHPLVYLCPRRKHSFAAAYDDWNSAVSEIDGTPGLLVDGTAKEFLARTEGRCTRHRLFPDDAGQELIDLAPVLLRFEDVEQLIDLWSTFWGRGIASTIFFTGEIDHVLEHLRRSLYVEVPGGELCLLRFHDPRVLFRLSSVLEQAQIEALLGDVVATFIFEGPEGELCRLDPERNET